LFFFSEQIFLEVISIKFHDSAFTESRSDTDGRTSRIW